MSQRNDLSKDEAVTKSLEFTDAAIHTHTHSNNNNMATLHPTMTLSAEMFERLYLQPKPSAGGELRKMVANPTPLALVGFVVGLTPLSAQLMGWADSGGGAQATTADSIWFGGLLLLIAGLMDFMLGNTFTFVVFMAYGAHFLTFATSTIPWFHAVAAYSADGSQTQTPMYEAGFGFYTASMAALSLVFLIGSLRTNLVFVFVFTFAVLGFTFASVGEWTIAKGDVAAAVRMLVATGACFFAAACLGWYMLLAQMLAIMELPVPDLPIFDLSTVVKATPRA